MKLFILKLIAVMATIEVTVPIKECNQTIVYHKLNQLKVNITQSSNQFKVILVYAIKEVMVHINQKCQEKQGKFLYSIHSNCQNQEIQLTGLEQKRI